MAYRMRRYRRHDDRGLDDWLMTYADMITLLLCFFAVFLSVSVPKQEIFKEAQEKMLEQFAGKDPEKLMPSQPLQSDKESLYDGLPSLIDGVASDNRGGISERDRGTSITHNKEYERGRKYSEVEHARLLLEKAERELQELDKASGSDGKGKGGDRIKFIETPSAAFFNTGSADLSADGKNLLIDILNNTVKPELARGYVVTIEGHTDDVPIRTVQFPSNWELSTARAASVVRFFIEQGVPAQKMRASGYADSFPKAPNRDEKNIAIPENQAQNRRVIIKLEKIEKDQ